jgi:hypothetical protein
VCPSEILLPLSHQREVRRTEMKRGHLLHKEWFREYNHLSSIRPDGELLHQRSLPKRSHLYIVILAVRGDEGKQLRTFVNDSRVLGLRP